MKKVTGYFKILGARVKKQRIEKELSQRELSKMADISIQTISIIENSTEYNLRKKSIDKLAHYLCVTEDYLKGLSDVPIQTADGLIRGISFPPDDDIDEDEIFNAINSYKEAFLLLAKCEKKLDKQEKNRLIKILKAFLE